MIDPSMQVTRGAKAPGLGYARGSILNDIK
jgi:hypothetical protein